MSIISPINAQNVFPVQNPGLQITPQASAISFKLPEPISLPSVETSGASQQTEIIGPTSWGQMVHQMLANVNEAQVTAGDKIRDVLAGGPTQVHEAMIATQEAGLKFQMLSEVRNKFIESYQEIMRMQV